MNWFRIISGTSIVAIVGIITLIQWHKKIDSEITWIYGIYILLQVIVSLSVLIVLEQFWIIHK